MTQVGFNGRRVLVTGGSGFLGRWVCEALAAEEGAEVTAPRSAQHDLRDAAAVERLFAQARPQVVIHLAAVVGGIGANRKSPGRFFHDNALMGIQVIEAARRHAVERFVCVGTVCSYPKTPPIPFREEDLWNGYPEETNAPYGLAKRMLLVQMQAYRDEYGTRGAFLIPTNLYGPGDHDDPETSHVIPGLIRRFIEARERGDGHIDVWGTGAATREFLYAADAAEAIVRAAAVCDDVDPINLGSGHEISIRDLVTRIAGLVGYAGEIRFDASRPDGQPRRCVDSSRAERILGWRARTSFDEGLAHTVDWFEKKLRGRAGAALPS